MNPNPNTSNSHTPTTQHPHKQNIFTRVAKKIAEMIGSAFAFSLAFIIILVWILAGYFFQFSDTWQLVINTSTSIITFLIVFLIQHTQNRDTIIINVKLDEIIKALKNTDNQRIDLNKLNDDELKELEDAYNKLCHKK